jgi:hypothetical protein
VVEVSGVPSDLDRAIRERLADRRQQMGDLSISVIRAVLDEHPRSLAIAGELPERFGEGRCAYCRLGEPIRRYQGHLNGSRRKVPMHDHVDPHPYCSTCHTTTDYEGYAGWPCATVKAIAVRLGVAGERGDET